MKLKFKTWLAAGILLHLLTINLSVYSQYWTQPQ